MIPSNYGCLVSTLCMATFQHGERVHDGWNNADLLPSNVYHPTVGEIVGTPCPFGHIGVSLEQVKTSC